MCGIVGLVNRGSREQLASMVQLLHHRGPDDRGTYGSTTASGDFVGLGSTRLSILDLSPAGHMPMRSANGRYVITYNGECYNHRELRARYLRGHAFRSTGDTETVLELFSRFGPECAQWLNGMFAFAIWDEDERELYLFRDHFGIKPLYLLANENSLAFASEIKAFMALPEWDRAIDHQALKKYLTFLWVPEPRTIFAAVKKLPAGHWAKFSQTKGLRLKKYWDLSFPERESVRYAPEADIVEEVRERFFQSCNAQLLSDVPVGAFLSAGLDSSSIVAAISQQTNKPIQTFTIAFPHDVRKGEVTLDDPSVAARTAQEFGCNHIQITVEPNVTTLLPKLIYHMDEPVADPALITAYLVCHDARRVVTVLLSGIGGDEMFAGYRKYQAHEWAKAYQWIPSVLRRSVIEPGIGALPAFANTKLAGYVRLTKKMARSASLPERERFIQDSVYLDADELSQTISPSVRATMNGTDPRGFHLSLFESVASADFLHQMLYLDSKMFLPSLNLLYNDKMSMAASVETRVPFLDWELADWVAHHVPPAMKLHGSITKYGLRQAMKPLLSDRVLRQKKAGFGAPVGKWIKHDLREMFDDVLSESELRKQDVFDPAAVQRMRREHELGQEDWQLQLWSLLTFNIWYKTFQPTL